MILNYFVKEGEYTHRDSWDGDFGFEFEYEPKKKDLLNALVSIIKKYYFKDFLRIYPHLKEDINDVVFKVVDDGSDYFEEQFREELTEYFESEALASFY